MPSRRQILGGAGSVATAALAGCLDDSGLDFEPGSDADADWPMPRYDHRNAAYSPDAVAPRDGVRERWTVELGLANGTPAVADGTAFVPTAAALVALDAADGSEVWRFEPGQGPWFSSPSVHDGLVFVGAHDESGLYALDAESGEAVWSLADADYRTTVPHLVAGEDVHHEFLYVGDDEGGLRRLDPATGEEHWRVDLFGAIATIAFRLPGLYVGTRGGEVYEFVDHGDGDDSPSEGWRRKVGSAVEAIVPDEEGILVDSFGGPLRCLGPGAHAGATKWTVDAKWANAAPVNAGYTFFSTGYDGVVALREFDHHVRWRLRGRYDRTDPVAAGDTLYASSGDAVHAFALDGGTGVGTLRVGAERWSHPTPAGATEGLAVGDGALFVACQESEEDDTSLYCLEPA